MAKLKDCKILELSDKGVENLIKIGVEITEKLTELSSNEILNRFKNKNISNYGKKTIDTWIRNATSDKRLGYEAKKKYFKLRQRVREGEKAGSKWTINNMIPEQEFYNWYNNEVSANGKKCFYCDILEDKSAEYYAYLEDSKIRTPWAGGGKSTRGRTLEIDRKDNKKTGDLGRNALIEHTDTKRLGRMCVRQKS